MKIAVSAEFGELDSPIEPRFGRSQYFVVTDTDNDHVGILTNNNSTAQGGAGIQTAQLMIDQGIELVITGSVGPKADQVLTQAGIKVHNVKGGTVKDALKAFGQGNPAVVPATAKEPHKSHGNAAKQASFKAAIATDGDVVAAHFGHCPHYTIVDVKDGQIQKQEVIANPGHRPGFLPGYLADLGIDTMIAGGMGASAEELFAERSIKTITGIQGRIDDVITNCMNGKLAAGPSLCDHDQ